MTIFQVFVRQGSSHTPSYREFFHRISEAQTRLRSIDFPNMASKGVEVLEVPMNKQDLCKWLNVHFGGDE